MQDAALSWLVFSLTHSSLAVGLLVFARFAPLTLLTPFAGVLADRFDNRRTLLWTNVGSMAVAAALAAVTLSGSTSLLPVYILALAGGSTVVFGTPNRLALISQLVGRDDVANAVALNSSLLNTTRVLGPALAGVLIASRRHRLSASRSTPSPMSAQSWRSSSCTRRSCSRSTAARCARRAFERSAKGWRSYAVPRACG